jgi:hypothetical protein
MIDLWPDKIAVEKMITPVTILRQQASLLGKKTKNIVQGEVRSSKDNFTSFNYAFYIVATALDNYRYKLLEISYNESLYPVEVKVESDIRSEISPKFNFTKEAVVAISEKDFLVLLREIFNSVKVLRVISVLLSQSDSSYDPSLKENEMQQ